MELILVFFNTLFGFFTFVAWAVCLLILFFIFTEKRFNKVINDQFYNFATLVAVVCSVGSLVYSEVVGFDPCKFCWYQRYLMYPIALILIIGLFKKRIIRAGYLSLVGVGIGAYHIYLQNSPRGGGSCGLKAPCDQKYVDILGFISIPVMASTGFLTIFLALLYYDLSRKEIVE
jgi:disulfide bond formation protein DsbB